jgi:hypothetical protein
LPRQIHQRVAKDKLNIQETKITIKTKLLDCKNWIKKMGESILDLSTRRILNFIFLKIKRELRHPISKTLYLISKISLQVASKSDYVVIVDSGHLKLDPTSSNRSFFMDYYPDLEETYKKLGKVTVLNLRPSRKLSSVMNQIRSGIWPVWLIPSVLESKKVERLELKLGILAEKLFDEFQYVMPENLKDNIHHYWPEIDFVKRNFKNLANSHIILLGWDGRNRGISVGLNEIGIEFSTYQSALGSYDLSHSGVSEIGLRSQENRNGVPTPRNYFVWRAQDKTNIRRLGFSNTEIDVVGSLRISKKRSQDDIQVTDFYSRHFNRQFGRCFIWAPVLSALSAPTLFKSRHDKIFAILQSKLEPNDCILIKPWPGADKSDFEKLTLLYKNTAIWNPKENWTNSGLLKLSFGVFGTFSSFLLEANNVGCRVLVLNFPESKNYFDFDTYRDFLNLFQSISSIEEMKSFELEEWTKCKLNDSDNSVFREDRVIEIEGIRN